MKSNLEITKFMKETESNIIVLDTQGFKFARGFQMPNDDNLEDKTLKIIKWGRNNLMPNFLNHLFYSSAYQSGIIRGKIHYITGSGWTPKTGTEDEINAVFGSWNCQDFLEMLTKDYELYNGFAVRVTQAVDGERMLEHVDFDMLRADINGGGWWYSDDWSKDRQTEQETGLKLYPNYTPESPQFESIYVYIEKPKNKSIKKSKKDAHNVYPEPVYAGCMKSLMTDVEIQSFHLYNIINGMKVAGVLNFANGEPPNKSQFEQAVQDALTPTENSGGVLINYSNGDDRKPSWIPLNNEDLDKRYLTLETSVVQNIMTGHGVTSPLLFGIKTTGQMGGTTEMNDSYQIFVRTYVSARQTTIESHVNYLLPNFEIQINEPKPLISEVEVEVKPTPEQMKMSRIKLEKEAEDRILLSLLKCGRNKSDFKTLSKNYIQSEDFDFEGMETLLKQSFLEFAVTDLEAKVLDLVRKGEKLDGIIQALDDDKDIRRSMIERAYQNLIKNGLISKGEITVDGVRELAQNQPEINLEVVYSYGLRPDKRDEPAILPDGRTRDFCRALIESNKVFTRQEIETISEMEDRNVWLYRGGWYSDPDKPRPTPFCRHIWIQELVISNR
jgi:hypothetical protein